MPIRLTSLQKNTRIMPQEDIAIKERLELCNFTVSGKHLWRSVITNPEEEARGFQGFVKYKCFACGIVNDLDGI